MLPKITNDPRIVAVALRLWEIGREHCLKFHQVKRAILRSKKSRKSTQAVECRTENGNQVTYNGISCTNHLHKIKYIEDLHKQYHSTGKSEWRDFFHATKWSKIRFALYPDKLHGALGEVNFLPRSTAKVGVVYDFGPADFVVGQFHVVWIGACILHARMIHTEHDLD